MRLQESRQLGNAVCALTRHELGYQLLTAAQSLLLGLSVFGVNQGASFAAEELDVEHLQCQYARTLLVVIIRRAGVLCSVVAALGPFHSSPRAP